MHTALILIDIQNDYFPGGRMEVAGSVPAAAAAARLLTAWRGRAWPVYHVWHLSVRADATFFLPGTPGADIHEAVQPLPAEPVITKQFPNSFRDTDLLQQLRGDAINNLLFCGMMSQMCVDATVRAAFDLGFSCTVAHDACAARELEFNGMVVPAPQVQASYMAALAAVYGRVKSVDEVLEGMTAKR